jgi:hypothetical protein
MWFLLAWASVPAAIALVLLPIQSLLVGRYFIVAFPALVVLSAIGICALPRRRVRVVGVALALGMSGLAVAQWKISPSEEDWRSASELILADARPGDGLIAIPWFSRAPFEAYASRVPGREANVRPLYPGQPWGRYVPGDEPRPLDRVRILAIVRSGRTSRVWLLVRATSANARGTRELALLREVFGSPAFAARFDGVVVERYDAVPGVGPSSQLSPG